MKPSQINVSISIPFIGQVSGTWAPVEAERNAAWELYLELVTRITVVKLGPDEGKLREALSSLYAVFGITREILRRYGPVVAARNPNGLNLGKLAVSMLNGGIRPVLGKWHPRLSAHESIRPDGVDEMSHERAWEDGDLLREDLDRTRELLTEFARLFGEVADVDSLLPGDLPIAPPRENGGGGGIADGRARPTG